MSKARRVSDDPEKRDLDPWLTNLVEHEGFPLALRVRPNIDTADNRSAFSRLLLVTHELAQVRSNGLPEFRYNHSLSDFDQDMFQFLEGEGDGIEALWRRSPASVPITHILMFATFRARLADLTAKYPQHVLNVGYREEPNWETYELYRKLYRW